MESELQGLTREALEKRNAELRNETARLKTQQHTHLAELFYEQCVGEHNGHMASIPNNPLFQSVFRAAGYSGGTKKSFANVLRQFAVALEASQENQPF